jgi:hypothetical protein
MSTGNDFKDDHYNFENIRNAVVTLLIIGTGNGWTEIISELDNNSGSLNTFIIQFYFFTFYISIMIVFKLFSLMNIQKNRLQNYKTSYLAQEQIEEFRVHWRNSFSTAFTQDLIININQLFDFLSVLPSPLGCHKEGVDDVLFQDLDRFTRTVLICLPKNPKNTTKYTTDDSDCAFTFNLLPKKLKKELSATGLLGSDEFKFYFRDVLIAGNFFFLNFLIYKLKLIPIKLSSQGSNFKTSNA